MCFFKGLRPDVPRSVVANLDFIIVAILGTIDLYSRRDGRHLQQIHRSTQNDLQWHLSLSEELLVAKQLCENRGRMEVFSVENDFK